MTPMSEHTTAQAVTADGAVMRGVRGAALPVVVWAATRALLMLCVFKVLVLPGADVTVDVSGIYHGWYEVLRTGTFPLSDVTWQYPPGRHSRSSPPPSCRSSATHRPSSC